MDPTPSRRDCLRALPALAVGGLSGCSVLGDAGPDYCSQPVTPRVPTGEGLSPVGPAEYPGFPEEVTESSVGEYAQLFEKAYRRNRFVENRPSATGFRAFSFTDPTVDSAGDGFLVSFQGQVSWRRETDVGTVHADEQVAVTYFVSERAVLRADGADADPRTDGEVVLCRPDG